MKGSASALKYNNHWLEVEKKIRPRPVGDRLQKACETTGARMVQAWDEATNGDLCLHTKRGTNGNE